MNLAGLPLGARVTVTNNENNFDGSINTDDGRLNFDNGDWIGASAKVSHDLSFEYENFTVFSRFYYFYDNIMSGEVGRSGLSDRALDQIGSSIELLDLYVSGNFNLGDLPLTDRPFAEVGAELGMGEDEVLERLRRLFTLGVLTRFGPLVQIERAGGRFVLAALEVPEPRFDEVAAIVNALPEVAHNYRREHALNMWFVLAAETPEGMVLAPDGALLYARWNGATEDLMRLWDSLPGDYRLSSPYLIKTVRLAPDTDPDDGRLVRTVVFPTGTTAKDAP